MPHERSGTTTPDPIDTPGGRRFDGITARSLLLSVFGVVFVAAFTPYNDFVLKNTRFIGNHFPIGITLMMLLLVLGVNPILTRFRPSAALRSTELIVIWTMCLVSAAFPGTGLLRQLIPWMVAPIYYMTHHPEWSELLDVIPHWMFPTIDPANEAVVTNFMLGKNIDEPLGVPWAAWIGPLVKQGLYYVPLFLGMMLFGVLMSRQWIVHEKLQYPIASIMLDMVRDAPGQRCFNALFTNRRMWAGAGVVMAIHLINGLHAIFPKVPLIPIEFDLRETLTEGFWPQYKWYVRHGTIYFSMIGIAFLMATQVSFSLWSVLIILTTIAAILRYHGVDPYDEIHTQATGAALAMGVMLLFLARSHLWRAFRVAFGPGRAGTDGTYASYRWVVRGLVICLVIAVVWQWCTGMPLPFAIAQVVMAYLSSLVVSRIVAETGMFFVPSGNPPMFWHAASRFKVLWFNNVWPSARAAETLMPYVFNALWLRHATTDRKPSDSADEPPRRRGWGRLIGAMTAAMLLSMVVAAAVWITIYYSEGLVRTNEWIGVGWSINICKDMMKMLHGLPGRDVRSSEMHVGIGAAIMVVMGLCRYRIPRWPFVPIALCLGISNHLGYMWLSILIGWACKVIVMRTGGVSVYQRLRPVFLGMVFGEVLMAGVWMAVGAVARVNGFQLASYQILPGN